MSEEWGPWIEHDGKGCPCVGLWVHAQQDCLPDYEGIAGRTVMHRGTCEILHGAKLAGRSRWDWSSGASAKVIRYRIRRPKALQQLIEMVENLPAPAQPRVDA